MFHRRRVYPFRLTRVVTSQIKKQRQQQQHQQRQQQRRRRRRLRREIRDLFDRFILRIHLTERMCFMVCTPN